MPRGLMNIKLGTWITGLMLLASLATAAVIPEPNWERADALSMVRAYDTTATRQGLLNLTIAGSTAEVLDLLQATGQRNDWPAPVREAVIFTYTQELRTLPPSAVPVEIMTYLKAYRAITLVPHDDHPSTGVPLYNIRAAAAGVEFDWLRQDALLEGLALLKSNPRALADVFLIESHPAARQGYLATLDQASQGQLFSLSKTATRRLKRYPELTPLAGQAALRSGNLEALQEVFLQGQGPYVAPLMRESAGLLPAADTAQLMAATIEGGGPVNAALAIAELAPAANGVRGVPEILMDQLADPELGAPAAMALAQDASPATLRALGELAESGNPLTASRARMALDITREQQ